MLMGQDQTHSGWLDSLIHKDSWLLLNKKLHELKKEYSGHLMMCFIKQMWSKKSLIIQMVELINPFPYLAKEFIFMDYFWKVLDGVKMVDLLNQNQRNCIFHSLASMYLHKILSLMPKVLEEWSKRRMTNLEIKECTTVQYINILEETTSILYSELCSEEKDRLEGVL